MHLKELLIELNKKMNLINSKYTNIECLIILILIHLDQFQ